MSEKTKPLTKPLVIYHGGCDDGFAAAWCVRHFLGAENVDFHAGVYQEPPPDVTGRDVILVDFSYKRPVLMQMAEKANTVMILDHHKTAAEDLAGFPDNIELPGEKIAAVFDMTRSGAGLAWDFFHPGEERPEFINYIEDRDLWKKTLPGGDEFTIALRSYPQDFAVWDVLIGQGADALINQGRSIQRYYRLRVDELKANATFGMIAGHAVLVANAPYFAASEVAGELAEGQPFGASFFRLANGKWQYSLRSRDGGVDVSAIAKLYGGGGHRNAAGFTVDWPVHIKPLHYGLGGAVMDVEAFHLACGVPIAERPAWPSRERENLRHRLLMEEFKEHEDAWHAGDMTELADAIGDIIYILIGTALEFGIPLDKVWAEIQRSNMAKVDSQTGAVRYREDGKILKPEGWTPPDIAAILAAAL